MRDNQTVSPLPRRHASPNNRKRSRRVEQNILDVGDIACKRCRGKKVKCDGKYPSCSGCVRADVPCIVADWSTSREYSRSEVHDLEQKLQQLEDQVSNTRLTNVGTSLDGTNGKQSNAAEGRHRPQFLFNRTLNPHFQPSSILYHRPHPPPPLGVASHAIEEYFHRFHIAHPFLDQQQILSALDSLLSPTEKPSRAEKQKIFKLNMVLAIGSIRLFRDGISSLHPFGFFTAALEACPPLSSSFDSIDDLECFLLIARFGVYYNIGCSIWELGRLCVRIAIELGLHQAHTGNKSNQSTESNRYRILFWESYLLDTFSSSTLGRPFAIDESSISTELPDFSSTSSTSPSVPVVFNALVRLSRIISGIHCYMLSKNQSANAQPRPSNGGFQYLLASDLFLHVRRFAVQLREWRTTTPVVGQPSCVFETEEYFDLCYQEARLSLLRAALNRLLPWSEAPTSLSDACLQSAYSIIMSFEKLRKDNLITCTRQYAHLIFLASIVTLLVIKKKSPTSDEATSKPSSNIDVERWVADLEDDGHRPTVNDAMLSLHLSGEALAWFAREMPDVTTYTRLSEALRREIDMMGGDGELSAETRRQDATEPREELNTSRLTSRFPSVDASSQMETVLQLNESALIQSTPLEGYSGLDADLSMRGTAADSFAIDTSTVEGLGGQMFQEAAWPFSSVAGMENFGSGISEYLWDMIPMWEESPSGPMESHI